MNKTIVITGASTGIGRATAIYFAEKGWNVAATMRSPEKERKLQTIDNIKVYKLDVTKQQSINDAYKAIVADYGKVDVLLNNAGYALNGPFEVCTDEQIRAQFDVNVFGLMNTTRAFIPHFRENKGGIILNISSMGGKITFPLLTSYHATKFAVEGFSEVLGYELDEFGIKVKLIEPGNIATDFGTRSMVMADTGDNRAYDKLLGHFMNLLNNVNPDEFYSSPEMVAEVIYTAATDGKNQSRYIAGDDAKQLIELKQTQGDDAYIEFTKKQFLPK
ncbi:SDR family oxidoreductase [Wukongibacter baidiensis]|uniref:SDR family oxidoreductase n=1 Tax=Wukongibacter baidiensis TaxID=1723361 RepID=UPI003D7FB60C